MAPWELEAEAPDLWVQRWGALREARAQAERKTASGNGISADGFRTRELL